MQRLEPYFIWNTGKRKKGTNQFEKDTFKVIDKKSILEKTIKNLRERVDSKFIEIEDSVLKN